MLIVTAVLFLLASIPCRTFAYPALSLAMVAGVLGSEKVSQPVALISRYSYEFYLCHGIFLVGSEVLLGRLPFLSIPLGIVVSMAAAVGLSKLVMLVEATIKRHYGVGMASG